MKEERNFVDEALLKRYPTLKGTVNRARKLGFELLSHRAYFTRRGAVYQHLFYTKDSETGKPLRWTHQELKGWCSVLEAGRRYKKEQDDKAKQANNAGTGQE